MNLQLLQNLNRLRHIFGPIQDQFQGPVLQQQQQQQLNWDDVYNPSTKFSDMFSQHLMQFPTREAPSKWRKFGAFMAGLGSEDPMKTVDEYINYPFYQKLADWQAKMKPLESAMNIERQANVNERQLAAQIMQEKLRREQLEEQERKNREQAEIARLNAETRARIASLQEAKFSNPDLVFKTGVDGYVYGIHPQTGQEVKTTVKVSELNDLEKMNLGLLHDLKKIEATGEQQRQNIAARIVDQVSGVPFNELEKQRAIQRRAMELHSLKPEWSDYLEFTDDGKTFLRTKLPVKSLFGLAGSQGDPKILEAINKYIYGDVDISKTAISDKDEYVNVISPNGVPGKIHRSELEAALAAGWRVR